MYDESDIIESRQVWSIVCRTTQKLVDTRWVFKKKKDGNGKARYRDRLCARGFKDPNQYRIKIMYLPTAKLTLARMLLALAVEHDWSVYHAHVSSAFLYGDIHAPDYIAVPQGMDIDPSTY